MSDNMSTPQSGLERPSPALSGTDPIRTVLCPIDFTPASENTLPIAALLCRQAGARLVLHHNLGPAPPDFLGVHWMWDEEHADEGEHEKTSVTGELERLFATLPEGLEYEARISRGPLADAVLHLARELPADLVVLGSHGRTSAEHRSLTDQVVLRAPCSVLATAEAFAVETFDPAAGNGGRADPIVVATDLSGHDRGAVALAFELAAILGLEIHLVHVLKKKHRLTAGRHLAAEREAQQRLASLVPDGWSDRAHLDVRLGSPAGEILAAATAAAPRFLLLGARKHGLLYRAFAGLTSLEVLHASRWPVWFVPAGRPARRLSFAAAWHEQTLDWRQARDRTIARWEEIRSAIGRSPADELAADVNAIAELCVRRNDGTAVQPCDFCVALGAVGGCAQVNQQVNAALLKGDWERSRLYVDEVLQLLRDADAPPR